jgi:hypothetical protein
MGRHSAAHIIRRHSAAHIIRMSMFLLRRLLLLHQGICSLLRAGKHLCLQGVSNGRQASSTHKGHRRTQQTSSGIFLRTPPHMSTQCCESCCLTQSADKDCCVHSGYNWPGWLWGVAELTGKAVIVHHATPWLESMLTTTHTHLCQCWAATGVQSHLVCVACHSAQLSLCTFLPNTSAVLCRPRV